MNRFLFSRYGATLAIFATSITLHAQSSEPSVTFSYADTHEEYSSLGTKKAESYDVAIEMTKDIFAGKTITQIKVPVYPQVTRESADAEGAPIEEPCFKDLKVWLTTNLDNVIGSDPALPFMAELAFPEAADPGLDFAWVTVDIPEGYTIPESGVYAGYSFTIDLLDADSQGFTRSPIAVASGDREGSLWVHTSKTYKKWKECSLINHLISPIQIILEGDFPQNALQINSVNFYRAFKGESGTVGIQVSNMGTSSISSLKYRTTLGNSSWDKELNLEKDIPAIFDYPIELTVEVPETQLDGTLNLTVEITSVNGEDNCAAIKESTSQASFPLFFPKNTPLVEENTGTTCGFCTRGFAAMEKMRELYPAHSWAWPGTVLLLLTLCILRLDIQLISPALPLVHSIGALRLIHIMLMRKL